MKRPDRSCRMTDDNGRACRRPKSHRMHEPHAIGCPISPSLHHEYTVARKAYGRFRADPFVRTSLLVRMSSLKYLRETYGPGSAGAKIREFIAADQGVSGHRLRHYIGDPITTPRKEDGTFLPKEAVAPDRQPFEMDDPYSPPDEQPSREKVIEAFEAAKSTIAAVGGQLTTFHVETLKRLDEVEPNEPVAEQHDRVGAVVRCAVCGKHKKPRGRSAPLGADMCERPHPDESGGCNGYDQPPHVGSLWPGETCGDFGYDHSHDGTEQAEPVAAEPDEDLVL